jgi:hypothetical protein
VHRENVKNGAIAADSKPLGRLKLVTSPIRITAGAGEPSTGFSAAGAGSFQPLRFTIVDLAIVEMVQGTADHGSSIGPTAAVGVLLSRWEIAALPLPAAIPPAVDHINLSTMAEQALESLRGSDGLDGLLDSDSP